MDDDLDWKAYMRRYPHIKVYGFQRLHIMVIRGKWSRAVIGWTHETGGGAVPLFFVVGGLLIVVGILASIVGLLTVLMRRASR